MYIFMYSGFKTWLFFIVVCFHLFVSIIFCYSQYLVYFVLFIDSVLSVNPIILIMFVSIQILTIFPNF